VAIGALVFGAVTNAFADSAVIVGAGQVGAWTTTGYVANTNGSTEALVVAYASLQCEAPLFGCPPPTVVRPLGSAYLYPFLFGEFGTFYVTQQESAPPPFPVVRASLTNDSSGPARSVDIPVVLLSRLMAANISTLNFGGVTREAPPTCAIGVVCYAPHSTLVLGNIQRADDGSTEDLPVKLELFDTDGSPLSSTSLTIPYGETTLIGDVVEYVGGGILGLGQLRITRTSGGALMSGILYTTAVDGAVTASAGVNLSP
jgi:hypothetical protein